MNKTNNLFQIVKSVKSLRLTRHGYSNCNSWSVPHYFSTLLSCQRLQFNTWEEYSSPNQQRYVPGLILLIFPSNFADHWPTINLLMTVWSNLTGFQTSESNFLGITQTIGKFFFQWFGYLDDSKTLRNSIWSN